MCSHVPQCVYFYSLLVTGAPYVYGHYTQSILGEPKCDSHCTNFTLSVMAYFRGFDIKSVVVPCGHATDTLTL